MSTSLEDVLSGKEPEPVETTEEPVQQELIEETQEVVDEPKGEEEVAETEPEVEKTVAEPPSEHKEVPLAALLDERDKRKAETVKREAAEAQLAEKAEKPDFWENPDAAISSLKNEMRAEFSEWKLAYSMETAANRHEDYQLGLDAFKEAAEQNNLLAQEASMARDPGEYIYKTGMQFRELNEVGGDVNALRESIRAEERAKLEKELQAKSDKLDSVPEAITDETSAAAPREKVEGGPTPLANIFPNQR